MLELILTGNPQQEVVNFLAGDLYLSSVRSRQLWLLLLQRQSMLLLPTDVGKGGKKSKPESTLDDSTFDDSKMHEILVTGVLETEEAKDEGRQSGKKIVLLRLELPPTTNVDGLFQSAKNLFSIEALPTNRSRRLRSVHEKELAEMERERKERQRQDQVSVDYIASLFDEVQAKMDASKELAARLQMEEREMYTIEERYSGLYIKEQKRLQFLCPIGSERVEIKQEGRKENIRKRSEKIDYEVMGMRYPIVNWESAFYHTDRYGVPHDYYRVFRTNGSSRYIKTFTEMVSRFDRLDFIELHSLVMQRFSTTTPEGIDLVLWGDLRIMLEETCKMMIIGIIKRYPLIRETLERMMELRLTVESEGEAVFDLLRFIQKHIDEFGGQDGIAAPCDKAMSMAIPEPTANECLAVDAIACYMGDDDGNDDDSDEVTKDDDDDESDANGDKEASDSEKTDSDEDENPNLNQNDDEEEEYEEELKETEHEEEGKGDEEMTNDGRDDSTQQTTYVVVKDDEHVKLTTVPDTQKTEVPLQSSSISSDFANQFLNMDNVPPTDTEVVSMMNVKIRHEEPSTQTSPLLNIHVTIIPETSTVTGSTIPPTIPPITPLPQQSIPTLTPAPTTATTTTSVPTLLDFSSLFGFDQRVSTLEKELYQFKAKDERKRYIDLVEKSEKDIIKDEVKSQLPQILPMEVSDYATLVIQSSITKSLENIVLAKSSSQPKSTYEAAASLTEFEFKKILLDKIQKSKSYRGAQEHKDLYDALVKSYKLDKDLFKSYGKVYLLKRDREDKYKDEDPPTRSDQELKKQKTSKDAEPSRGSKSKESKSSSSKGSKSQPKSSSKPAQAKEPVFEATDTEMPLNQGDDLGNTDDQPNVEAASRDDWFKKPERPLTPYSD
ncbi:hypothetical protein Tco_0998770 [Tanacetum coccineum]